MGTAGNNQRIRRQEQISLVAEGQLAICFLFIHYSISVNKIIVFTDKYACIHAYIPTYMYLLTQTFHVIHNYACTHSTNTKQLDNVSSPYIDPDAICFYRNSATVCTLAVPVPSLDRGGGRRLCSLLPHACE